MSKQYYQKLMVNKIMGCKKGIKYPELSKENSSNWKGGKYTSQTGYVFVHSPTHPSGKKTGYVREHRLVMEKHLGRYLSSKEIVHHVNDKRDDNRIENLKLCTSVAEHKKEHYPNNSKTHRQCCVCEEILELNSINFYKKSYYTLGFDYTCKSCQKWIAKMKKAGYTQTAKIKNTLFFRRNDK